MKQNANKVTISDKYLIIEKLGNQTNRKFGSVFLAKNKETDERVVIKTISGDVNTPAYIQLKEEQFFSFSHQGLPKVIDFYELGNELFLVKKFQEGIPLDEFWKQLKRKEKLPFLVDFLDRFAPILNYIHNQHIIHCDLKPSNILIRKTIEGFAIELIDFGLAVRQPIETNRKLLFPLGFAAPELLLNQLKEVNRTSDYFSLGIIFWKLYHGMLPLMHSNPSIYTNLQLTHPVEDSSKLPRGLFPIIQKLTQKPAFKTSPNRMQLEDVLTEIRGAQQQRYQSLEEVIDDFKSVQPRKVFGFF